MHAGKSVGNAIHVLFVLASLASTLGTQPLPFEVTEYFRAESKTGGRRAALSDQTLVPCRSANGRSWRRPSKVSCSAAAPSRKLVHVI